MLSLEQVRALEARVERALAYITTLREENTQLQRRLGEAQSAVDSAASEIEEAERARETAESAMEDAERRARESSGRCAALEARAVAAEARAEELESKAEEYRRDQGRIEEGIVNALEKLNAFEDLVRAQAEARAAVQLSETPSSASGSAPSAREVSLGISVKKEPRPAGLAQSGVSAAGSGPALNGPALKGLQAGGSIGRAESDLASGCTHGGANGPHNDGEAIGARGKGSAASDSPALPENELDIF